MRKRHLSKIKKWLNLRQEVNGMNIVLKQANNNIPKDKFSALAYGIYYLKTEEDNKKKNKGFKVSDFMFIS